MFLLRTPTVNCLIIKTSLTLKACALRSVSYYRAKDYLSPNCTAKKHHHCEGTGPENLLHSRHAEADPTEYRITLI